MMRDAWVVASYCVIEMVSPFFNKKKLIVLLAENSSAM